MPKIIAKSILWVALCSWSLSSCSNAKRPVELQPHEETREFSEADKRAARVLSISNTEVMANAESPYVQALLCRHGIAELVNLINESSPLNNQQEQGLRQAEAFFEQRLRNLANANGKSSVEVREDLEKLAQAQQDKGTNLRIAASCVEKVRQI